MPDFFVSQRSSRNFHRLSIWLVLPAVCLTFFDLVTGRHGPSVVALGLVTVFILIGWRALKTNARMMLIFAVIVLVACLLMSVTFDQFAQIASRSMYLPALVFVMTVMRVAAQRSDMVVSAGHFVVEQPPSRRFALLAVGGHIFGMLLNIGGFLLLMTIATRTVTETAPDARIAEIQTRRVTNAILRGFAATLFWSPLGVAINLLLPIFPGLRWVDFLPYGLGGLTFFLAISWAFDQFEPRARRAGMPPKTGRLVDLLGLLGTLALIAGGAGLIEVGLGLPLRAAILLIVPIYATLWAMALDGSAALWPLATDTARQLPNLVSEICVMTASGFVGLALATLLPTAFVQSAIGFVGLSDGLLASAVAAAILGLSLVGISPVITGTLFVAAIAQAGTSMPDEILMLAALTGWSCAVLVSPMTSTLAIASGILGRPASVIGLGWNGKVAATILVLASAGLIILY